MGTSEEVDSATGMTAIAVALGRLEKGQETLVKSVDEIKNDVKGFAQTVSQHSTEIAQLKTRQDHTDEKIQQLRPPKAPWTAVAAFIVAGVLGFYTFVKDIIL